MVSFFKVEFLGKNLAFDIYLKYMLVFPRVVAFCTCLTFIYLLTQGSRYETLQIDTYDKNLMGFKLGFFAQNQPLVTTGNYSNQIF